MYFVLVIGIVFFFLNVMSGKEILEMIYLGKMFIFWVMEFLSVVKYFFINLLNFCMIFCIFGFFLIMDNVFKGFVFICFSIVLNLGFVSLLVSVGLRLIFFKSFFVI